MTIEQELNVLTRGVVEVIPENGLKDKLIKAKKEQRPLIVKLGADPTAPDIHLGHTVVLKKLKDFQTFGHKVIFLIGDFTSMIGDPSGKSKTRRPLTKKEVEENAKTYESQIFKILDPKKTQIRFNSEWNAKLTFEDVIRLTSNTTVAQMLERDDFKKRYQKGNSITITEFLYGIIQGYDSVALKADIELGGTDQKFNLLLARDLQRELNQEPQTAVIMPILEGLDGVNKMSKSLDNYIGISDSADDMFGKIMSISDDMIIRYFTLLTDVSLSEIDRLNNSMKNGTNPRDIKVMLAKEVITSYYNEKEANQAYNNFNKVFVKKALPSEIPEYKIEEDEIWIIELLNKTGITLSKSDARRLVKQGGVYIDSKRVSDEKLILKIKSGMVIKAGKRRFLRLIK